MTAEYPVYSTTKNEKFRNLSTQNKKVLRTNDEYVCNPHEKVFTVPRTGAAREVHRGLTGVDFSGLRGLS